MWILFTKFVCVLFSRQINVNSRHLSKGYLMLNLPLKFHQDPLICDKLATRNSIQCKVEVNSGQFKLLSYCLLNLCTWFHTEVTPAVADDSHEKRDILSTAKLTFCCDDLSVFCYVYKSVNNELAHCNPQQLVTSKTI